MFSLNKKPDDAPSPARAAAELPRDAFIPYYAHYDPHTLITKNGELLQIIRITSNRSGLNYESGDGDSLRETVRRAVTQCIGNDRFALWVHTLRKRKPVHFGGAYAQPFAEYMHRQWGQRHHWQHHYYNEVYVSVLHEGQSADLLDTAHLRQQLMFSRNRGFRAAYLEQAHRELEHTVTAMLQQIRAHYNAHLLSTVERVPSDLLPGLRAPVFFSEPMEFLGTLLNLSETPRLLPEAEIGQALADHTLTFGYNALESKNEAGKRRFAALLTLKHYQEAPPETIDRVLQASCEFIISQSFGFSAAKQALKACYQQKELFDISGDAYSRRVAGIDETLIHHQKRPIDFGEQQTSIAVITDEYRQLEAETQKMHQYFGEMGMTTVREDIMIEDCFWAQLPGNFEFLRRKDPICAAKAGGFARLNRFPAGDSTGNHWNEAVAVFPSLVGSPYFFNFHHRDNGHTLLLDFNSFNDRAGPCLVNFLAAASLKFNGRLYSFDSRAESAILMDKLQAPHHPVSAAQPLAINPLGMEPSPRNLAFLCAWCALLIEPRLALSASDKEGLRAAVESTMAMPPQERRMETLLRALSAASQPMGEAMSQALSALDCCRFDGGDFMDGAPSIAGIDMEYLRQRHPQAAVAVFAYALHRVIMLLDGSPAVIVLHEAPALLDNAFFAPRLESLMEMLTQHNALLLCRVSSPQQQPQAVAFDALMKHSGSLICLPDELAQDYGEMALGLSATELALLRRMSRATGDFLLRQGGESIALRANLDDMPDIKAIFAGDLKTLITAGGPFASARQRE